MLENGSANSGDHAGGRVENGVDGEVLRRAVIQSAAGDQLSGHQRGVNVFESDFAACARRRWAYEHDRTHESLGDSTKVQVSGQGETTRKLWRPELETSSNDHNYFS